MEGWKGKARVWCKKGNCENSRRGLGGSGVSESLG